MNMKKMCVYLAAAGIFICGCQKKELAPEPFTNEEGFVAIELGASSSVFAATKSGVDKWNGNTVNVFGLRREKDASGTALAAGSGMYDFTNPYNIVDYETVASSGKSAKLEVYSEKSGKIPYHYTEMYVYDFYGYHLGGAEKSGVKAESDTYSFEVNIDGSNDLMYAFTDRSEDMKNATVSKVSEDNVYSAWAARRGIHPTLLFSHALTRLNFIVKGKGDSYQNVTVSGISVRSVSSGTFTVIGDEPGFVPSSSATPVSMVLKTSMDAEYVPEKVKANADDIPAGGEGACLMVAPGMNAIDVIVNMLDNQHDNAPLTDYSFTVKASDVKNTDSDGNEAPVTSFEAGTSYDIFINVYGPEDIEITAKLTEWKDGGDYTFDPDDYVAEDEYDSETPGLHKVTGIKVYADGEYYGVIKFGYDDQGRHVSTDAVYESGGSESFGWKYLYTSERVIEIESYYEGRLDDAADPITFDTDGRILTSHDGYYEYETEGDMTTVTEYGFDDSDAENPVRKWSFENGNCISYRDYSSSDDVECSYYDYPNDYTINLNAIMTTFGYDPEGIGGFYTHLGMFVTNPFTSSNLLKNDGCSSFTYEFDTEGKVATITQTTSSSTYTMKPYYENFDEIYEAFPEEPSSVIHKVTGAKIFQNGRYVAVVQYEYDESERIVRILEKQTREGAYEYVLNEFDYISDSKMIFTADDVTDHGAPIVLTNDGHVELLGDWDIVYDSENNTITNGEDLWIIEGGNIISIFDYYDDVYYDYKYYPYLNNYSINMNGIQAHVLHDGWDQYSCIKSYRLPDFTSENLIKSGAGILFTYEFDSQDRVSVIMMVTESDSYEVEIYYDDFEETFDAFSETVDSESGKLVRSISINNSSGINGDPAINYYYGFNYDSERRLSAVFISDDNLTSNESDKWYYFGYANETHYQYYESNIEINTYEDTEGVSYSWAMNYNLNSEGFPAVCSRHVEYYDSTELLDVFSSTMLSGDYETITYDTDGYVTEIAETFDEGSDSDDCSVLLSWENGNITSESYMLPGDDVPTIVNYEYTDIEDKTNLDLTRLTAYTGMYYRGGHYMADKSVFKGMSSKMLPKRSEDVDEGVYEWSYTFDADGYVTEVKIKSDTYSETIRVTYY